MTLKERPEDFIVIERLAEGLLDAVRASGSGPFAVYELQKAGLDTAQAVTRLARATHTRPGLWRWAGLKDKHAQTTQAVSVAWPNGAGAPPPLLEEDGWSARLIGFSGSHLSAADIAGNRFRIRVGGLSLAQAETMRRRAKALRPDGEDEAWLIPNYFGDQRFSGVIHPSAFAARELVRGDLEAALKLLLATPRRKEPAFNKNAKRLIAEHWGDWAALVPLLQNAVYRRIVEAMLRTPSAPFAAALDALDHLEARMLIESYQSWLWNRLVAAWTAGIGDAPFIAKDRFGSLVFPDASTLLPYCDALLDLPSPNAQYDGDFRGLAEALYREEGLCATAMELPVLSGWRFGEARRSLVVTARRVSLEKPLPDERHPGRYAQLVHLDLPRGAYATCILRALGQ